MSLLPMAASAVEVVVINGTIGAVGAVDVMTGDEGAGDSTTTTVGAGGAVVDEAGGVSLTFSTTTVVGEAGAGAGVA